MPRLTSAALLLLCLCVLSPMAPSSVSARRLMGGSPAPAPSFPPLSYLDDPAPEAAHSPALLTGTVSANDKMCTFTSESGGFMSTAASVLNTVVGTFVPYGKQITTGLNYIGSWAGAYDGEGGIQVSSRAQPEAGGGEEGGW